MAGDIELFKEMRRAKTGKGQMDELAKTVDGVSGEQGVADTFAKILNNLYNSSESKQGMTELQDRICGLVQSEDSMEKVNNLTAEMVKQAAVTMKPHKMDVSQGFSSAFIPLVKAGKDSALSGSYRAITGSSLLLKLFERCILLVWGDKLHSDQLQLGFKQRCSTGQATWLVQEVLQHYLRQGGKPVAVVLDCTKAFDMAKFDIMFGWLLERGMPAIVVKVLAFSYTE